VEIQVRERVGEDLGHIRKELAITHREFAEAVGRIVSEQLEAKLRVAAGDLGRRLDEEIAAVRGEIVRVHEDFTEAMTAFISDQVEVRVEARAAEIERTLEARVVAAVAEAVGPAVENAVNAAVQPAVECAVRAEAEDVRQQAAAAQTAMVDFVAAVGAACRDAAAKTVPPAQVEQPAPSEHSAAPVTSITGETAEGRGPEFNQLKRTGELLRIPLVSSFVLAVGGLLVAHYL
jgi:hypothetical protein